MNDLTVTNIPFSANSILKRIVYHELAMLCQVTPAGVTRSFETWNDGAPFLSINVWAETSSSLLPVQPSG